MRRRAEAATPGPWERDGHAIHADREEWDRGGGKQAIARMFMPHRAPRMDANAEHIASWHPAVALAVADWLEQVAEDGPFLTAQVKDKAATVASAYMGEAS